MQKEYKLYIWEADKAQSVIAEVEALFTERNIAFTPWEKDAHIGCQSTKLCLNDEAGKRRILSALLPLIHKHDCMLYLQEQENRRTTPIAFFACDLDGTLIQEELLVCLAEIKGIQETMQAQTQQAILGAKAFSESFAQRTALLKGISLSNMQEAVSQTHYARGAKALLQHIKNEGIKTALLSSNYQSMVQFFAEDLAFDYYLGSEAYFDDACKLSGELKRIIDTEDKAKALSSWLKAEGISPKNCLAIGDGTNDLEMLSPVGHSVLCSASAQKGEKNQAENFSFSWLSLLSKQTV